jgi:hypothetical protein
MKVTVQQARAAYDQIRFLDAAVLNPDLKVEPIRAFKGNVRAKHAALLLLRELQVVVDASNETVETLREAHGDDAAALARALRAHLKESVDLNGVAPLRASLLGSTALERIPTDTLLDLGPFFEWDINPDG